MKLIILAAGKGQRLYPLTRNTPKPLIPLGDGHTLLEKQLEGVIASGVISEVVLVVGYLAEQIESKVATLENSNLKITCVYNPFYEVSNNLISLWLAKEYMHGDFFITNGDNLFDPTIFEEFDKHVSSGIFLSVYDKTIFNEDDMKVTIENDLVQHVSKEIPQEMSHAESPGLALVKGDRSQQIFLKQLEACIRYKSSKDAYWLQVFNFMNSQQVNICYWKVPDDIKWQEVDFHFDLDLVRRMIGLDSIAASG